MKNFIFLFLLTIGCIAESKACLNYYYTVDKHGHMHNAEDIHLLFDVNFNKNQEQKKLIELKARMKKEKSWKLLSDYAVCLLKLGESQRALEILIELEKNHPDQYQLAANLGTAYELNGDVENALKFIHKGIKLNPDAHGGSEWIHVKILEAKLAMKKNSDLLNTRTVLMLTGKQKEDTLVRDQILVQMKERFPFSPAPDAIVASLLIDLGDCFAHTISFEHAKSIYTLAKEHHGANSALVSARIAEMVKLREKYKELLLDRDMTNRRGMTEKITGIRYKELLRNFPEYGIVEWTTINTPLDTLLAYCGLVKEDTTVVKYKIAGDKSKVSVAKSNLDTAFYVLMGLIALLLLIGLIVLRKRKSAE